MLPRFYPSATKTLDRFLAKTPVRLTGITIHYTADTNVERVINALETTNLGYHIIIDRDGSVIQMTAFDKTVNHAGIAEWNKQSPNRTHVAVAVVSWGAVTKKGEIFEAWNGFPLASSEVRRSRGNINNSLYFWHAATSAQEKQLRTFLFWALRQGIKIENICGHDESAQPLGRKSDPGGVLSLTMKDLRNELKTQPYS